MTAAEYRTLREACGMTQGDCVAFHGVVLRTIQYWEEGRNHVPADAAECMRMMSQRIDAVCDEIVAPHARTRSAVVIHRYRTMEAYAASRHGLSGLPMRAFDAAVGRALIGFMRRGREVCVVWAEDAQGTAA